MTAPTDTPGPAPAVVHDPREREAQIDATELTAPVEFLDSYLGQWLEGRALPRNLRDSIRYAVLGPGKRLRPLLVVRCCELVGGTADQAAAAAAAIEMVHAFSLVHDDLPALDDDDLRRGRPTLHKKDGEALAILAGDALLGLSFELALSRIEPPDLAAAVCRELSLGRNDMLAGQVYDTLPAFDASVEPMERLKTIHRHKTGALIRAACRMGALCGWADEPQTRAVTEFGEAIGLMFQVVDDVLDVTQTTEHLGKTAGKDRELDKLTYPALIGIQASRTEVRRLRSVALRALEGFGDGAAPLRRLCEFLALRTR